MPRVLNVAEKNDVAKNVSEIMSNGHYRKREGLSKYNKIYEFEFQLLGQRCNMIMTSVSGHLLGYDFVGTYRQWLGCAPVTLFDAPLSKSCSQDGEPIKRTLEREVKSCDILVIWTDCDREGENIGMEIVQVCKAVRPNIRVLRARFSEITRPSITRACQQLVAPDERVSAAVDVRQELDLRIGAAFTRFQTLRLKKVFPLALAEALISYGSCQFPTLGFVVERYKQVQQFIPEPFWKICVTHKVEDMEAEFTWARHRLFDHTACLVLFHVCQEATSAVVVDIQRKPKSKWRPLPLDTVELEKLVSRKLHIGAKDAMKIAEKLYTQGYISYPRTETNVFPRELDLSALVQLQLGDPRWGEFAARVIENGPNPRHGNKSDNAHPPIHPTKAGNNLEGNESRIYELIARHFLACCSDDAKANETTVEIDLAKERFVVHGLEIIARNYLEVYPYEKWSDKAIPNYELGQSFVPTTLEMVEGETSAPPLLTEADLIALMDKHGIGTDATHAEHIETIKQRMYVALGGDRRFVPGELGLGLVEGYDSMGFAMSKPNLRAELEADLKRVCEGTKSAQEVLTEQIRRYREVFVEAAAQATKLDESLSAYFGQRAAVCETDLEPEAFSSVSKCPLCLSDLIIRRRKESSGFYITCASYPTCKKVAWLPDWVKNVETEETECDKCHPHSLRKLRFRFRPDAVVPLYPPEYVGCLGGCEPNLLELLGICSLTVAGSSRGGEGPTPVCPAAANNRDKGMGNPRGGAARAASNTPGPLRRPFRSLNLPPESNDVVCRCGESAPKLTVRKEGPNQGRQFYGCRKNPGCGFFLWADDDQDQRPRHPTTPTFDRRYTPSNPNPGDQTVAVHCQCGIIAKTGTVQKAGPNQGRPFKACSKPREQQCSFFQWDDEPPRPLTDLGQGARIGGGRGRKRPTALNNSKALGPSDKKKRSCSVCGVEGHNKMTCPQQPR